MRTKKNVTWTNDEKNILIEYLLHNPPRSHSRRLILLEDLAGIIIPNKTMDSVVQQATYMFRQVKQIYKIRHQTGQGSTVEETQGAGDKTTYGYDRLEPLVAQTVAMPLLHLAQQHGLPEPGTSRTQLADRSAPEATGQAPVEPEQAPIEPEQAPVDVVPPINRPSTTPVVAVREEANGLMFTREPRRLPVVTSVLGRLNNMKDLEKQLFLAADATRREQLEVDRGRLKVAEGELELKRKQLDLEQRRVELEEKMVEKELALKERRMNLEFEFEEKKLEFKRLKLSGNK